MAKYLKLRHVPLSPEAFVAFEYDSDRYWSWAHRTDFSNITWQSDAMPIEALATLLRGRGWHTTDIGDEIDEAQKYTRPEA